MRMTLIALAVLAAHVIAFPAHAAEDDCYAQTPAKRVQPVNTIPRRVKKTPKSVQVGKPRPARRVKAKPKAALVASPAVAPVRIICPDRPPVAEVFLPPSMTPARPHLPGFVPPLALVPPAALWVPPAAPVPPQWLPPDLAVAVPPPAWLVPPVGPERVAWTPAGPGNDLPTFPPNGTPAVPGVPVWVPPVVTPGIPARVPVPGTLLLIAGGALVAWKVRKWR